MILIKKSCGCSWINLVKLNDDAVLVDFIMPGGIIINTAAVYGQSHKDDKDFWNNVKYNLDLRTNGDGRLILGD